MYTYTLSMEENRVAVITARTTSEEKEKFKKLAEERKMSISDYLRELVIREIEAKTANTIDEKEEDNISFWIKNGLL